ncbi:MAP3K7IP1 [Mytilus edulis]|uniref:MAP3K7IP1 n=1 Tax=Mytilus edulis TaxID=6550 RepID=A0A8S3TRE3_MYTED|nr:MAP3K7IP1 [Mytilus edulis]
MACTRRTVVALGSNSVAMTTITDNESKDIDRQIQQNDDRFTVVKEVINIEMFSSFPKLLRIMSYVLRFIANCRTLSQNRKYQHLEITRYRKFFIWVFDGHDGSRVANFAAQRMPAELLLGQLNNNNTDEEIKEILYQGISHYEACKQYPDTMKQLNNLEKEIPGGTTTT